MKLFNAVAALSLAVPAVRYITLRYVLQFAICNLQRKKSSCRKETTILFKQGYVMPEMAISCTFVLVDIANVNVNINVNGS